MKEEFKAGDIIVQKDKGFLYGDSEWKGYQAGDEVIIEAFKDNAWALDACKCILCVEERVLTGKGSAHWLSVSSYFEIVDTVENRAAKKAAEKQAKERMNNTPRLSKEDFLSELGRL